MGLIDFILNLAGLLLWLNWLSVRADPLARPSAATLAGTLRKASHSRPRRAFFLTGLASLLLIRAFFYWAIGSAIDWSPNLRLVGDIKLYFPLSAAVYYLGLMVFYSFMTFAKVMVGFYSWLVLLSFLGNRSGEADPFLRLARAHLGRIAQWPWPIRLGLPFLVATLFWLAVEPLLIGLDIVPRPMSWAHRLEQAAVVGVGTYLTWKYLVGGLLALSILNSYVYLGSHPFWTFITVTAQRLLQPLSALPLRAAKVDFAPLVAVAIVFLIAEFGGLALNRLYGLLPL